MVVRQREELLVAKDVIRRVATLHLVRFDSRLVQSDFGEVADLMSAPAGGLLFLLERRVDRRVVCRGTASVSRSVSQPCILPVVEFPHKSFKAEGCDPVRTTAGRQEAALTQSLQLAFLAQIVLHVLHLRTADHVPVDVVIRRAEEEVEAEQRDPRLEREVDSDRSGRCGDGVRGRRRGDGDGEEVDFGHEEDAVICSTSVSTGPACEPETGPASSQVRVARARTARVGASGAGIALTCCRPR